MKFVSISGDLKKLKKAKPELKNKKFGSRNDFGSSARQVLTPSNKKGERRRKPWLCGISLDSPIVEVPLVLVRAKTEAPAAY